MEVTNPIVPGTDPKRPIHTDGKTYADGERSEFGKALAPATDETGADCWNVWVSGDRSSPHTFHNDADAKAFATRKQDDGLRVFTDFSGDPGDSGEVFNDSCS